MAQTILYWTTLGIEMVGIAVIVIGIVWSLSTYVIARSGQSDRKLCYQNLRASLGRAILLGLEFLVAADIISTVAVEPSVESVLVLAGIVLIRTFLSFALEVEIEGRLPWQRK